MDDGSILPTDIACLWKISSTQALYCRHLYFLFSEVRRQVKCEENCERILYVDDQERSIENWLVEQM